MATQLTWEVTVEVPDGIDVGDDPDFWWSLDWPLSAALVSVTED